ncbi:MULTISPECIES: PIG-L deacetylase family protein [Capnocytophaga]|uniref:PIG-L deacetylase family protein n=1 Tax=Capnocytophaga TaxID=1016 RepID=UPI0018E0EED4|nr:MULTISPECIES: PIG-L deacetylase family protein [Capnocytophaga]MBI1669659.1 PIG-L family deacetylase [Capnocytophaga periodontitidis]MBM0660071.1 PIG-L family deacetylase [Capnocytophaga genosp. AHN8471]
MRNIVVISAHPDDEILGVGGTLLKHKKNGDKIYWLITTNIFENQGFSKQRISNRQKEIKKISEALSVEKVFMLNYPTMSLSTSTLIEMVPKISKIFIEIEPEIVYCLNRSDAHSDHRITFDAVMACTKSFRYPFIKQVLMYECISETEFAPQLPEKVFIPNYFVDISSFLEEKMNLMKIYESELGKHPFPRSLKNIEALATFRGASVGVEYAEAFQLIKYIDK